MVGALRRLAAHLAAALGRACPSGHAHSHWCSQQRRRGGEKLETGGERLERGRSDGAVGVGGMGGKGGLDWKLGLESSIYVLFCWVEPPKIYRL